MFTINEISAAAFGALSSIGESVTFRGQSLQIPSINLSPSPAEKRSWNLGEKVKSILLLPGTLAPDPSPDRGESVLDGNGRAHRIVEYRRKNSVFECACVVSKP